MASWLDYIMNAIKPVQTLHTLPRAPEFKGPMYTAGAPARIPGMIAPGNTDLTSLPVIYNPDGSYSTVHSMGFTDEDPKSPYYGKQVLARGILNGKRTDDVDAVRQEYYRTGKHLGIFTTPEAADAYGIQRLHTDWDAGLLPGVKMPDPRLMQGGKIPQ